MNNPSTYTVYNASAGSGKTYTLVREYLQILLKNTDNYHFQKVLAITFTNKAATEMKDRVLETLQALAKGKHTDLQDELLQKTGFDKKKLQQKATRLIEAILRDYTSFNITTIDSFTHRIIRSFAYDLGLSINFNVELDGKKIIQEAVDTVIDQIGIDDKLTKALISYSHQRSEEDKAWDISSLLYGFSTLLLNETDKQSFKSIEDKNIDDYTQLQKKLGKEVAVFIAKLNDIGIRALDIIQHADLEYKDFYRSMLPNHFVNLANNWEKAKFFDQSTLRNRIEENTVYSQSKPAETISKIENVLPQLLQHYLESEQIYQKLILFKLFRESLIPLSVLSYVNNALKQIKEDNNTYLISEFNELIFNKIKDEPAPFIYERLGEKFHHYFIDEMQDTSTLQWANLSKLIDNALAQEGRSLLLVGDAKQAIYRWRGGESDQFIKLSDDRIKSEFPIPKKVANLETNYRSYTEIIDFNNSFFQHIASLMQNDKYESIYIEGNNQKNNKKIGGYVQVDFVNTKEAKANQDPDIDVLYPKKVLESIENLDASFQWKDICILVRKNKQGIELAKYLTENNIDIISSESLLLATHTKVDFLINLLQSLWQTQDKTSRYNLLDFVFSNANTTTDKHQFIVERIHLEEAAYYESLQTIGYNFHAEIFHQKSLYDAVEYSIRAFNLAPKSDAYLQYFMDVVLDFQIKEGSNLSDFLTYWEQNKHKLSISIPEGKNAVQIMTIHKAKGLQFPIVIFPYDLDMYRQINPTIWYPITKVEQFNGFQKMMIPYKKNLQYTDETGFDLYNQRQELLELDNYNLLYVTLTRAVEQLYIITEYKLGKNGENTNFYSGLFINYLKRIGKWNKEQMMYSFGDKVRVLSKKEEETEQIHAQILEEFISTDILQHQVNLYQKSSILWGTEQGEAINYGNLLHDIFQHIYTIDDVESALQLFLSQGVIQSEEADLLKDKIIKVVKHPKLETYYQYNLKIFNEREMVNAKGISLIPDRVVVFPDNTAVIIDYKTGVKEKKHVQQITQYADYLIEIGYQIKEKLLVYIKEEVEIVSS